MMKLFKTTAPVTAREIKTFLDEHLNAQFEQKRQLVMPLKVIINDYALEITNDENYNSFLFKIEVDGPEVRVTKSEHYTDDVNALAIEDILNKLFLEFPDGKIKYTAGEN